MAKRHKIAGMTAALAVAALTLGTSGSAIAATGTTSASKVVVVASGQTLTVTATTRLDKLVIEPGGVVTSPAGTSLSLTVDGVETGSRLTATGGTTTALAAGTYRGKVVLTVAAENPVTWQTLTFPFRQAVYVGSGGVDSSRSVLAAVTGGKVTATSARAIRIRSTGEAFNGLYNDGGTYTLKNSSIALRGNGRSDFVGYGAAVTSNGTGSRTVLDHVDIDNKGAVRTGVVAEGGSNVLVKNSRISTSDGTLPADYQSTVDLTYMESAPWMLGIVGNVRATNLLGVDTKATYLNSDISSTGWGVLSTDSGQDGHLTAIDSYVHNSKEGYGSYAIGNATEEFLGNTFAVKDYATINRGGAVHYGDSTKSAVAALNDSLGIGLTASELRSIPVRSSKVTSDRFGVMWHGAGSATIDGGTRFTTRQTTFLDKGQQVALSVDGSTGAKLTTRNGVLFQLMEDDDPGPQMVDGKLLNTGVYHEPTTAPAKDSTFDTTAVHATDAAATFKDITLNGDFYNGGRNDRNLVLTFDGSSIKGVISASTTKHAIDTITSADYQQLGEVTNTTSAAVNNGVVVDLAGSTWTPTGTSYLSHLGLDASSRVKAPAGHTLSMTVDGVATPIQAGHDYSGDIVVSVN